MPSRSATHPNRGTAMIELIGAIAIFMVVSIGLGQVYIRGFRATKEAREELAAARLLANELESWRIAAAHGLRPATDQPLRALNTEDRLLENLSSAVSIVPVPEAAPGLFQVSVRLAWDGPGGRRFHREAVTRIAAMEAAP